MPVQIPLKKIQALTDPFQNNPWHYWHRLTRKEIREAIKNEWFMPMPMYKGGSPEEQAHRIAYLVVHGWSDAISLDVGVPSLGCCVDNPILDGHHRLAAAIYRKDESILATVDGSIDYAFELFGVDVTENFNENRI